MMQGEGTMKRHVIILIVGSILGVFGAASAASPPGYIHYQGVLRDAAGAPLDGTRDMVFRFYDGDGGAPPCPASGGTLLLTDSHVVSGAVEVQGGLFDVDLGAGSIASGTAGSLAEVFRDHGEVYLEVQVGGEILCPRVRVVSAAYSLNAAHLDGKDSSSFLDTSTTPQSKSGPLYLVSPARGIDARGNAMGGYFKDLDDSGYAYIGYGDYGLWAWGTTGAGHFNELDSGTFAGLAQGGHGIEAGGEGYGARFQDNDQSGSAYLARGDYGV
jgi:hypothetical protein